MLITMFESEINENDQLINQLNSQLIISETPLTRPEARLAK